MVPKMAQFFFHVRDRDGEVSRDSEGQAFADLDAARREAENSHRELLGENLLHGGSRDHRQIEIANEEGEVLAVIKAKDVLIKDDQPRLFDDDVTKSAPTIVTGVKPDLA